MSSHVGQQQLQQHQRWSQARERLWTPPVRVDVPEVEAEVVSIVGPEPAVAPVTHTREAKLIALRDELKDLAAHVRQARERVELALGEEEPLPITRPSVRLIVRTVAVYYRTNVTDILSHTRIAIIVRPRQVAMYLAKQLTLWGMPEIGRRIGGRDHTTVLHAHRKIASLRQTDSELDKQLTELTALLTLKDEQT